jgi:hypothetical protein
LAVVLIDTLPVLLSTHQVEPPTPDGLARAAISLVGVVSRRHELDETMSAQLAALVRTELASALGAVPPR